MAGLRNGDWTIVMAPHDGRILENPLKHHGILVSADSITT
jgi:hypothetical protein